MPPLSQNKSSSLAKSALFGLSLIAAGCGEVYRGSLQHAEIFVVGDSALEWHLRSGRSAPERMGEKLDRPVYNAARRGQMMTEGLETSIPNQYIDGDWDWVVINGGFNDLSDLCQCGECPATQENIHTVLSDFVSARVEEGKRVLLWSYYDMPRGLFNGEECNDAIQRLRTQKRTLADAHPNVFWVDGREAISKETRRNYYIDRVHPSRLGSKRIGQQLADAILAAEGSEE